MREALLLLSILASACSGGETALVGVAAAAKPPSELRYGPGAPQLSYIKIADVIETSEAGVAAATGKVAFNEDRTSRVASPISGRIIELLVKPGDKVKKGQPLLTIVSPEVESALADMVSAESELSVATRGVERARRLFADQAIPKKELQQAESDAVKANAVLERARSKLKILGLEERQHTSKFSLRAPIDGTVVERSALPGMEVRSDGGAPLLTVADLSVLWVQADIYERDLPLVSAGQAAHLRVPACPSESFDARVDYIGEMVDPQTRTVKIRLSAQNPEGKLKPEMFAKVSLELKGAGKRVAIPTGAVLTDGEASAVILAQADGRFEKRAVEVGSERDGKVRVLSGLKPGDKVVTEGALFLKAEIESR